MYLYCFKLKLPLSQTSHTSTCHCRRLLLFRLFSLVFYCETMAWVSVATLWNNWLVQNQVNAHVRPTRTLHHTVNAFGLSRCVFVLFFFLSGVYVIKTTFTIFSFVGWPLCGAFKSLLYLICQINFWLNQWHAFGAGSFWEPVWKVSFGAATC